MDLDGETQPTLEQINDYMESALAGFPKAKQRRRPQVPVGPEPTLPFGCIGIGCGIRAQLEALAAKCGGDMRCWQQAIEQARAQWKQGIKPWNAGDASKT